MEKIETARGHKVKEWEDAADAKGNIQFEIMSLHRGYVTGAKGYVFANNKQYKVSWLHDGRCYYSGKRARQYDIIFN